MPENGPIPPRFRKALLCIETNHSEEEQRLGESMKVIANDTADVREGVVVVVPVVL